MRMSPGELGRESARTCGRGFGERVGADGAERVPGSEESGVCREGDAIVGSTEGRARRPHDGHRRRVGHHHRVSAGAGKGRGRRDAGGRWETRWGLGVSGEVKRAAAPLAPLTMGLVASTSNCAADARHRLAQEGARLFFWNLGFDGWLPKFVLIN